MEPRKGIERAVAGFRRAGLLAISISSFLLLTGYSRLDLDRGARPPIKRIVLVTIDALRADHLGAYGYPRETSPFLDSIATRGVLFERAIAPMASTVPSHATLFTGLYPIQLEMLDDGQVLRSKFETLTEKLKRDGFATLGFVSTGFQLRRANIGRGFDEFHEPDLPVTVSYAMARHTVDSVIARIAEVPLPERFFLFVHLSDPRLPQTPPWSLFRRFREETERDPERFLELLTGSHMIDPESWRNDRRKMLEEVDLYDAEVRHADDQIARLLRKLEEAGAKDDMVVIVTSDHGEGLGNHKALTHDNQLIYNETLRVPLIYYFPGRKLAKRFAGVVEHTDLFPTVLDLAGLEDSAASSGPVRTGRSLVEALFSSPPPGGQRIAFSQRRQRNFTYIADSESERASKFAVQSEAYKYIYRTDGVSEMFDLVKDPYEIENLAGRGLTVETELHDHLMERLSLLSSEPEAEPLPQ